MRRPTLFALLATCSSLLIAGCGGSSGGNSSATSTATSTATSGAALPAVSGSYGDKPTLTFPGGKPSGTLQSKVLNQGSGAPVAKGDLLVADYLGQIWGGKVFDNSYDRGQPAAFQIGAGKVIPGWDKSLVGVKSGSRVELVIPPADGYGSGGNSQAGIKGTDTLVFVVDVVRSYPKDAAGDPQAAPQPAPKAGAHVTGAPGSRPTVTVPKGTAPPKKTTSAVLDRGTGAPVKAGLVVVQYEAVTWAGKPAGSTWQEGGPVGVPLQGASSGSPFDPLIGTPIGSRVLIEIPPSGGDPKTKSVAVVIDVVGQPQPAKDAAGK